MSWCLLPEYASKFLAGLRDGSIDPAAMEAMSSAERRDVFARIVGPDVAHELNAGYESKLILKDKQAGLINWIERSAGLKEDAKRDLISRIMRMDKVLNATDERAFLEDLARQKLGASVTMEEASALSQGAKDVEAFKARIDPTEPNGSPNRIAYGLALDRYQRFAGHLMGRDKGLTLEDLKANPIATTVKGAVEGAGVARGLVSSGDLSYTFRQGNKAMWSHPIIWFQNFVKQFQDIGKSLKGVDAEELMRAEVISRQNAIDGKYNAMGLDVNVGSEEAVPTRLPEKIPLYGKVYKASEAAYNGFAMRLRADYADFLINMMEKRGIDMTDPRNAKPAGNVANTMSGRGNLGALNSSAQWLNKVFFSVRFWKSNLDFLTGHVFDKSIREAPPLVRRALRQEAAMNLAKWVAGSAMLLAGLKAAFPDNVELNPLSSKSGKITVGHTTLDLTGGMGPLITFVARLATMQTKSATKGTISDLSAAQFGKQTGMDVLNAFWESRLSPVFGVIRDRLKGRDFQGRPFSWANAAIGMSTPMTAQTIYQSLNEPDVVARAFSDLMDFFGSSSNPPNDLGLGLSHNDPVEMELQRLGFTSQDFDRATGDPKFDALIQSKVQTLVKTVFTPMFASPGWDRLTEAQKSVAADRVRHRLMQKAAQQARAEDPQAYAAIRAAAKADPRREALLKEMEGTPQ